MLEIQEKFSFDGYENLVKAVGNNNLHITEAVNGEKTIGYIAYAYETDKTLIFDYDDGGDLFLCDGLIRSVLFKSCLKGIDTAVFELIDNSKIDKLIKLNFVQNDNLSLKNLDDFMNSCKKCKKSS